jgi:transposase
VNRLIERCAMLDVHKAQVTACVRVPDGDGGRQQEIREFGTTTAGLLTLADWLRSWAVTVVGMESTGVYWRAIYYLLEEELSASCSMPVISVTSLVARAMSKTPSGAVS